MGTATKEQLPMIEDVTLKKMTHPEIVQEAENIKKSLAVAYGKYAEPMMLQNLFGEIFDGLMNCWVILGKEGGSPKAHGFLATRILIDARRRGRKSLYLETLQVSEKLSFAVWRTMLPTLVAHAKQMGCTVIEADTISPRVARLAKGMGFEPVSLRLYKEL